MGPHSTCSKWACMSHRPGMTVLPAAFTIVAPGGTATRLDGPTAADAPVDDDDGAVRRWRLSSRHVENRAAGDRDRVARGRADGGGRVGHGRHAVRRSARHELRHGVLELRPHGLEVIELGVHADERRQAPGLVEPERLAAPHDAAEAVAIERRPSVRRRSPDRGRAVRCAPRPAAEAARWPGVPCDAQYRISSICIDTGA